MVNAPYIKQFDENGNCTNPITKSNPYQSRVVFPKPGAHGKVEYALAPNRRMRRQALYGSKQPENHVPQYVYRYGKHVKTIYHHISAIRSNRIS